VQIKGNKTMSKAREIPLRQAAKQHAKKLKLSPEFQAEEDYREDDFNNPFPKGSSEWDRYEKRKNSINDRNLNLH